MDDAINGLVASTVPSHPLPHYVLVLDVFTKVLLCCNSLGSGKDLRLVPGVTKYLPLLSTEHRERLRTSNPSNAAQGVPFRACSVRQGAQEVSTCHAVEWPDKAAAFPTIALLTRARSVIFH